MSVEMEQGRVVGLRFEEMFQAHPALLVAPRLPALARITIARSAAPPDMVKRLTSIEQPFELLIEEPVPGDEQTMLAALADVESLRKLVLRGAMIGEHAVQRFQEQRPDVEVVLEPAERQPGAADNSQQDAMRGDGVE